MNRESIKCRHCRGLIYLFSSRQELWLNSMLDDEFRSPQETWEILVVNSPQSGWAAHCFSHFINKSHHARAWLLAICFLTMSINRVVLIHFLETCSTWLWGHHRLPCPSQQPDIIEKLFVIDLDCCKTLWKRNKYCAIDCYTNKSFVINMLTLKYKDKIIYIKANSLREIYFIIL